MPVRKPVVPACACLLADHLDAVLAVGEDLVRVRSKPVPEDIDEIDTILEGRLRQRDAVERMRTLELAMLARIFKARERAAELARVNGLFRTSARLFASATSLLIDAAAESGDSTAADFDTADSTMAYLRSRGLVPEGQAALPESAEVKATETFLLAKRAALGDVMDLAANFLDALELQYSLYETDFDEEEADRKALPAKPGTMLAMIPSSAPGPAESLEARIETTLQAMFEPKVPEAPKTRGWAPGSLMAALSQAASEADKDAGSSAVA